MHHCPEGLGFWGGNVGGFEAPVAMVCLWGMATDLVWSQCAALLQRSLHEAASALHALPPRLPDAPLQGVSVVVSGQPNVLIADGLRGGWRWS